MMMARALRRAAPAVSQPSRTRVAVVLNANARRVTPRVVRALEHAVPAEDLFVSRSPLDTRRIARAVLERGYDTLFTGGGDGTFVAVANELRRQLAHRRHTGAPAARAPRLGVLKLGTGNALAAFVRASDPAGDGFLRDVLRARAGEAPGTRPLDLIDVEGTWAPFAGLGMDGQLLNDYVWVKERLGRGPLRELMTGPGGYLSAVALRTVPHYLLEPTRVSCEVVNGPDAEAQRLGPDGRPVKTYAPGATLFAGELTMAAVATMPFYGYGLRMFPFAHQRPGRMQLRLSQVGALEALAHLPALWKGAWFPEGVQDFHATEVTLTFERELPLQLGGDAAGWRREVTFRVAPEPVELVDLHAPRGA